MQESRLTGAALLVSGFFRAIGSGPVHEHSQLGLSVSLCEAVEQDRFQTWCNIRLPVQRPGLRTSRSL